MTPHRRFVDSRSIHVTASPREAFAPISRLGGETGWYFADALWRLRGSVDRLAGGVGLRRARGAGAPLAPGATVDFWRVEAFEPDRRLRLRAEMKLPGRAWLEFEVDGDPGGAGSTIRQTATFEANGLAGAAYWYALHPFHAYVFGGLARALHDEVESGGHREERHSKGVHTYERTQLVRRPLDDVFAFFADARNLEAITPPGLGFKILTTTPIEMRRGTFVDYQLKLHGLPVRWRTEIVEWDDGLRFVDVQRRGPYALWEHTHEFEEVGDDTLVRDRICYRLPLGLLGRLAQGLVRRDIDRIFDHRRSAISRLLEDPAAVPQS